MTLHMTRLPSGIRVLTDTVAGMDTVALGAYFAVGTRHEDMAENGIAHLVEHMMFKGTKKRSSRQIAETIEGIGGQMNAYTSREVTAYYFHVLKDFVPLTIDVLSDMIQNSVFDAGELDRERGVIIQEIGMNADTPDDVVADDFQLTIYPDQTLGAPILGRADVVAAMPRQAIERYVHTHYTPKSTVISAAGAIAHDDFVDMVSERFDHLPQDTTASFAPARYVGGDYRTNKELEQAHILLGFQGIKRTDPHYYNVVALAHILGGGMSSRLFQEIREKRGLVYNIHAFHSAYRDDGVFGVYAGTGADSIAELMDVLTRELIQFAGSITDAEIDRTRAQLKSSLLMGRESMMTRADQNAKHLIFHERLLNPDDLRARIDLISGDDISNMARQIFNTTPTLAALGPISQLVPYDVLREKLTA
jgi:predicted Zn-dependent peptidase